MSLPDPYYEDEYATIYHGDCREILPNLNASSVVTDPPFKLSEQYNSGIDADNLLAVGSIWHVAKQLRSTIPEGALAAVFFDNRILPVAMDAFSRGGWAYLRFLTLYRRWGQAHQLSGWMSTSDPVLLFANPGEKPAFYGDYAHDVYVKDSGDRVSWGPAQKPVGFLGHIVQRITPPEGVVIDPYAGVGSTLIAAQHRDRKAIGIEIEERYCEVAAERLSQGVLDLEATG